MIHYKSGEQLQTDSQRTPKLKKKETIDYSFEALCDFVKKEIMCYSDYGLSTQQIRYLQGLKTDTYNYDVILQCFTEHKNDIEQALRQNTFKSEYEKLCYACGVMKNHIIDILKRIDYKKKQEELIDYAMKAHNPNYNHNYENHYHAQQEEINSILVEEFKDLW